MNPRRRAKITQKRYIKQEAVMRWWPRRRNAAGAADRFADNKRIEWRLVLCKLLVQADGGAARAKPQA